MDSSWPTKSSLQKHKFCKQNQTSTRDVTVEAQLEKLYNADFSERIIQDQPERSMQDNEFMAKMETLVRFTDGHYEIPLPLKNNDMFPNNRSQAEQRATHLKAQFRRNTKFYEDYNTFMNDTISKNYAMRVPEEEIVGNEGRTWYIPHHGV